MWRDLLVTRRQFLQTIGLGSGAILSARAAALSPGPAVSSSPTSSVVVVHFIANDIDIEVSQVFDEGAFPIDSRFRQSLEASLVDRIALLEVDEDTRFSVESDATLRIIQDEYPTIELSFPPDLSLWFCIATPTLEERRWESLGMSRDEWVFRALFGGLASEWPCAYDLSDLRSLASSANADGGGLLGMLSLELEPSANLAAARGWQQSAYALLSAQYRFPLAETLVTQHGPFRLGDHGLTALRRILPAADPAGQARGVFCAFDTAGYEAASRYREGVSVLAIGEEQVLV